MIAKLCYIRDIYLSIQEFEKSFQDTLDLSLNEIMLICTLREAEYTAGELANKLCLTNSNTSKVIKSTENKGFIDRIIDKEDKRLMRFRLSKKGKQLVKSQKCNSIKVPDILEKIFLTCKNED